MAGKRVAEKQTGAERGGKGWLIPVGIVAALLAVYVIFCLWVVGNGKVMPNVSIAGLDVSGMTEEEAGSALEAAQAEHRVVTLIPATDNNQERLKELAHERDICP